MLRNITLTADDQIIDQARKKPRRRKARSAWGSGCRTNFQPLNRVPSSTELVRAALALQTSTGFGLYDNLILVGALQSGATKVFSEDLQHNQLIDDTLHIVIPFLNLAMQAG